jgi:hypothetical protein
VPRSFVVNLFWLAFGILGATTAIGLVTLWPEDRTVEQPPGLARPKTLGAEIVAIAAEPCRVPGQSACRSVTVELKDGKDKGTRATASPRISSRRTRSWEASSSTATRSPTSSGSRRSSGSVSASPHSCS